MRFRSVFPNRLAPGPRLSAIACLLALIALMAVAGCERHEASAPRGAVRASGVGTRPPQLETQATEPVSSRTAANGAIPVLTRPMSFSVDR